MSTIQTKKVLLYGVLSLSMAAATACSAVNQPNQNQTSQPNSQSQQGQTTNASVEAKKDPVKISFMANLHTAEVPSDLIKKMIEEKTNTILDIQWVPDGNYDEKMNASFATGSLPQVTFIKNQASFILMRDAIRSGQFWEVGPLLKEYPNLSKLKPEVLQNMSVDGKIYSLYPEVSLSRQGVIYRKDWADNVGLQAPKTIDELYTMLKKFTENDPDKNGLNDTIGLADRSDLVFGAFKTVSSYFGTPNSWGFQNDKLMPEFMFPEYMDTMKFFKKLHQDKVMNLDFPVTSKPDQQNMFVTGKAGVYIGSMEDVQSLYSRMIGHNPNAVVDVQNRIEGPKGFGVWALPGFIDAVLFPKSAVKSEKELRDILTFFDRLMEPELANLIAFGIEGKHYNLEGGKASAIEDRKLLEREVIPFNNFKMGGPSTIKMLEPYFSLPVRAKAAELVKDNDKIVIHDPTSPLDSKTQAEKGLRLQEIIKDATYKFILGTIDEAGFQKEIERWKKEGGDKIIEEYNASYKASKK
jgi:putative aldouronate transport system substrate-binding protein